MMSKDTLGRRIQAGRRDAGLSQEALGERLEVSRQAVSKWESDAAVPELEKLVAMSRLFGVTVGALLGVEPPEAEGGELRETEGAELPGGGEAGRVLAAPPEGELAAALAAWYAASRPRRRLAAVLGCTLAAALLVTLGGLAFRTGGGDGTLEARLAALEGQVAALKNSLARFSLDQAQEDGLVLTYDLTPTGVDMEAGTVTLRVSATPRELAAGAVGEFTAQLSDGRRLSREAVYDRGAFTAEDWALPLNDTIQVSLALTEGEATRTGLLETLYDYGPESTRLYVDGAWDAHWYSNGGLVELSDFMLTIRAETALAQRLGLAPVSVDLSLYRNEDPAPEQTFPLGELPAMFLENRDSGIEIANWTGCETSVTLESGDTVIAAVRVEDTFGQTVHRVLGAWTLGDQGLNSVRGLPDDWTPGMPLDVNLVRK